jgi:hypothetical protein
VTGEPISDDDPFWTLLEANAALGPDWTTPVTTVATFITALSHDRETLDDLVVSTAAWGDFDEAAKLFADPSLWGLGTKVHRIDGFPNVSYLQMIPGHTQATRGWAWTGDDVMVSLCWSEARGRWLIFSFGDAANPEAVPEID